MKVNPIAGRPDGYDVLIVGGGHGGAQTAIALRQVGFQGSIAIVGEENALPYERPPLSKDYLSGEKSLERLLIRPAAFWAERQIDMLTGHHIAVVDPADHVVTTNSGARIAYRHLVWAAGGEPRRLTCPGPHLDGVHTMRTLADADRLRAELPATSRIGVIGGGYIGLEAASVLVNAGKQVTVLEALDRVLARVAAEPLSRFFEAEHRSHGVEVRLGVAVEKLEQSNGRLSGVRLAGGEVLPCEMAIVGIGVVPAVEPLLTAGAEGGNGVAVDEQCRTSLADVFAVGDCALQTSRFTNGAALRIESVQNANDQATVVAKTIAGAPAVYDAVPWFWSNQYDLRLQTIGLSSGYDQTILRGDMAARSFSLVYLSGGEVIALDCVNAVRDYVQGRALVMARARVDPFDLANAAVPLKSLADLSGR